MAAYPGIVASVRANRAFLARAVRYLAAEVGIRQFLDVGTGIPKANNTHQVAQLVAPDCRVVYVDYDPVVLAHARALLASSPEGATDYIDADVRTDVGRVLVQASRTLDFTRPVAVMLIALMHFIVDADDPYGIVGSLLATLPSGSYLALSQVASDVETEQVAEARRQFNQRSHQQQRHRSRGEVARFFAGLDLVLPGVVLVQRWRPSSEEEAAAQPTMWCGLARKP
jgi:hypothetical protein